MGGGTQLSCASAQICSPVVYPPVSNCEESEQTRERRGQLAGGGQAAGDSGGLEPEPRVTGAMTLMEFTVFG